MEHENVAENTCPRIAVLSPTKEMGALQTLQSEMERKNEGS